MGKIHIPGVIKAVKKVRGGVKVAHHKNTAELEVVRMPEPKQVILPMQQHIGAPCTPTVKVGDKVKVGQVIGDSDKFVSSPIHASISGTVTAIGNVKLPGGAMAQGVTIESDGEMQLYEGIEAPRVETKEDFILSVSAVQASPHTSSSAFRSRIALTHSSSMRQNVSLILRLTTANV